MRFRFFLPKLLRAGLIWLIAGMISLPQPVFASQHSSPSVAASSSPGDIGWKAGFSVNGVNDLAYAVAVDGRNVYVGGHFAIAGNIMTDNIAMWDGSAWHPVGSGIDGGISALAVDGRGHLYAGGYFLHAGGKLVNNIARWDGQDWEAMGDGIQGYVGALAVDTSGDVYAGGGFTTASGVEVNGIAMWDGNQWNTLADGIWGNFLPQGVVSAITIDRFGYVYVGGSFSTAGGKPANNIARWDGIEWSEMGGGVGSEDSSFPGVHALATDGRGNLYAGGQFTEAGGVSALNVARWNGESWSALGEGLAGSSYFSPDASAIIADGGLVYVAGTFTFAGNILVDGIARWNGQSWENINAGEWDRFNQAYGPHYVSLHDLAMDREGRLFTVGDFVVAGGKSANHVAIWDSSSWSGLGADNSVDSVVNTMIPDGTGGIYLGGYFICAGGQIVNHIAHWDGSYWSGLGGGVDNAADSSSADISDLALDHQGSLYVGGYFTQAGNTPASNIAKWTNGHWESLGSGVNGGVFAIAVDSQDNLYVVGQFSTAGDKPANRIAEWKGGDWITLGNDLSFPENTLAIDAQDRLIAAGYFYATEGSSLYALGRWDGQKWEIISTADLGRITLLDFQGDTVYIGSDRVWTLRDGVFKQIGDQFYGSQDGQPYTPIIQAMTFDNQGRLVVGGWFDQAGNVSANNIARWNGSHWEYLGSGTNYEVRSLVMDSRLNLIVAGNFNLAGGKVSSGLAQWNDPFYQWLPATFR